MRTMQHLRRLVDQPLAVFGDPVDFGTYNAYGEYLTALEQDLEITMTWLGTPGAFSHCLARVRRADPPLRHLEFLTYAERYAAAGLPTRRPRSASRTTLWSLAWRDDDTSIATADFLQVAREASAQRGWLDISSDAPPWLPTDEPVRAEALGPGAVTADHLHTRRALPALSREPGRGPLAPCRAQIGRSGAQTPEQLVWPVPPRTQPCPQTMADTSGAAGIERAWPRT